MHGLAGWQETALCGGVVELGLGVGLGWGDGWRSGRPADAFEVVSNGGELGEGGNDLELAATGRANGGPARRGSGPG